MAEERVQKIIANAGVCSRRAAEDYIAEGQVTVNGKAIELGDKADPEKDTIKILGKVLPKQQKMYIALNKPKNVETTLSSKNKQRTIKNYLPKNVRLIPAGRLDYDAQGLLICTNDGDFAHKVMHPSFEIEKTYYVRLDGALTEEEFAKLKKPLRLKEGYIRDMKVKKLDQAGKEFEVTIHQGWNKIVKRIFKLTGHYVKKLERRKIGGISLGRLKSGQYRELRKSDVEKILASKPQKKSQRFPRRPGSGSRA